MKKRFLFRNINYIPARSKDDGQREADVKQVSLICLYT